MRIFTTAFLASLLLLAAGCATWEKATDTLLTKNSGNDFQKTKSFEAEPAKVFAAAKVALGELSFKADRVATAQGILDGTRRLLPGDNVREARQLTIRVKVDSAPGGSSVSVVIREVADTNFNEHAAMGTMRSLKEHSLYDLYFAAIAQALAKQ